MKSENRNDINLDEYLSVVMPVYNGAKYLAESIKSVLAQTYSYYEFIIVDDGSIDDTEQIIHRYQRIDSRIRYEKLKKNSGISNALNVGIKKSKGKYILRMDCDDILHPDRFKKQYDYFKENGKKIDVLGCYFCFFKDSLIDICKPVPAYADDFHNGRPPVHHPTCMIKREIFDKHGYYNSKYNDAEDVELWFRWYAQGVRFDNIPEILYKKRIHPGSVSVARIKHQIYLLLKINIIALLKYRIKFTGKGYLRVLEQLCYLIYLFLRLDIIYKKN